MPDLASWAAPFDLSVFGHAAYVTRRPALAAEVYRLLAAMAGRMASAGSGAAIGPVDAYLALAAATTGEHEGAGRHADTAGSLAAAWGLPVFARWFAGLRTAGGF
jgi:hypothetical protein